ncbi:hypothetical protein L4C34_17750 [Vibrio profundum]|uniref:hypothetical protein n=1 Tax=Vibrio profundum TaxID=2910247 RepID=UPI003D143ABD
MSYEDRFVECCNHGRQQATYVCQHVIVSLQDGIPRGFWSAEPEVGHERPDSWCDACEERVKLSGGEWDDESEEFAGVTLLCSVCYDNAKQMND